MTGPDIRPHDGSPNDSQRDEDGPDQHAQEPDPLGALVPCPPFRPDAVSLGPFDDEPFELQPLTSHTPAGNLRPGPEVQRCLAEWLTGALDAAGVRLGSFDRLQVQLIATDGWGPVQAVTGWITRARPVPPAAAPDVPGPDPPDDPDLSPGT